MSSSNPRHCCRNHWLTAASFDIFSLTDFCSNSTVIQGQRNWWVDWVTQGQWNWWVDWVTQGQWNWWVDWVTQGQWNWWVDWVTQGQWNWWVDWVTQGQRNWWVDWVTQGQWNWWVDWVTQGQWNWWIDWVSYRLSSISFYWNCFFYVRLSLILMKPDMNDMRAVDYKVTERILNICINYAESNHSWATSDHMLLVYKCGKELLANNVWT